MLVFCGICLVKLMRLLSLSTSVRQFICEECCRSYVSLNEYGLIHVFTVLLAVDWSIVVFRVNCGHLCGYLVSVHLGHYGVSIFHSLKILGLPPVRLSGSSSLFARRS